MVGVSALIPGHPGVIGVLQQYGSADAIGSGYLLFGTLLLYHVALVTVGIRLRPWSRRAICTESSDAAATRPTLEENRVKRSLVLFAILTGAVVVRLIGLGDGLWADEIATLVLYVRQPLGEILTAFESQNQHFLYTLAAKATTSIAGPEHEMWALRLPAAVLGVASVWAVYRLGIRVGSETEALTAAGLLAFSYHHVWFSQNARGYTGLLLGTLLGTWLFLGILQDRGRDGPRALLAYAVTMSLTTLIHLLAAAVVAAHGIVWAARAAWKRQEQTGWPLWAPGVAVLLAGTLSLQLYAPVIPELAATMLEPTMEGLSVAWTEPLWLLTETARGLATGLPGGAVVLVLGALIAAVGLARHAGDDPVFTALMVLPGLLTLAVLLLTAHNLWPRLFFFSAGFAALILVRGVMTVVGLVGGMFPGASVNRKGSGRSARDGLLYGAAGLLMVVASALTVPRAWGPKQDFVGAAEYIEERAGPGDTVVTVDMTISPYRRYLGKDWEAVASEEALERVEASDRTTWIVYVFPTRLEAIHPAIWKRVQQEYRSVARFGGTVRGGDLFVAAKG